jgi:hypothetical protein
MMRPEFSSFFRPLQIALIASFIFWIHGQETCDHGSSAATLDGVSVDSIWVDGGEGSWQSVTNGKLTVRLAGEGPLSFTVVLSCAAGKMHNKSIEASGMTLWLILDGQKIKVCKDCHCTAETHDFTHGPHMFKAQARDYHGFVAEKIMLVDVRFDIVGSRYACMYVLYVLYVCVHVCVYVCMDLCMYVSMCVCEYVCTCVCVYGCMHTYMHVYCMYVIMHICTYMVSIDTPKHLHTQTHAHTHIHTKYICAICKHTYTHKCM